MRIGTSQPVPRSGRPRRQGVRDLIPHFPDRATQWLADDPILFRDTAEHVLPPELFLRLDFRRAYRLPRHLLTRALDLRETDVLYYVACRPLPHEPPGDYFVTLHQEQNTLSEALYRVREGDYRYQYWDHKRRYWENTRLPTARQHLPPFLSVLQYTGPARWGGPPALGCWERAPAAHEYVRASPHWGFHFLDLHDLTTERLLGAGNAGSCALLVLRDERSPADEFGRTLTIATEALNQLPDGESGRWNRVMELIWVLVTRRRPVGEFPDWRALIQAATRRSRFWRQQQEEHVMRTMSDVWVDEGRTEGRTEGRAEGDRHRAQLALLDVLSARFQEVPPEVQLLIQSADVEQARDWLIRAAVAPRLEDTGILTPPSRNP